MFEKFIHIWEEYIKIVNEHACGTKFWWISFLDELEECGCVTAVSFPLQKQNKAYKGK